MKPTDAPLIAVFPEYELLPEIVIVPVPLTLSDPLPPRLFASEPLFDFDGQPKLLIDATTRRGMSGAMVVVSENGRNRLVGIYSGRYKQAAPEDSPEQNPNFTAELGWVFRSEVIGELISSVRTLA